MCNVIAFSRHQVSSAKVQPLQLREPTPELRFKMLQRVLQCRSRTLAMAMAMEALDAFRQNVRQLLRKHTEPAARGARVVKFCLYFTVFGVDTKPVRHKMLGEMGHFWQQPLILRKGIEGDVAAAMQYLVELIFLVCRAVGMGKGAELFKRKPCLA